MVALLEACDVILATIFDLIHELEKSKYFASFYPQTLLLLLKMA